MDRRCVLLKFGELALKGRNRPRFVDALERNLRRITADLGPLEVRHRGGVFIVSGDVPQDELVRALRRPARRERRAARAALRARRRPPPPTRRSSCCASAPASTFAVRARRRDKRFALRSIELARLLGDAVRVRLGLERRPVRPRRRAVRRGRPQGAARVGRAPARRRRTAGRQQRAGARAAVGRARLARRGLPDDEARAALRLRALQRPPVHEPGLDLQGVRAGRPARPLPGRLAAVRRHLRSGAAAARHGRRRAAPGALAAAADGPGGVGARAAPRGGRARDRRLARPGRLPDAAEPGGGGGGGAAAAAAAADRPRQGRDRGCRTRARHLRHLDPAGRGLLPALLLEARLDARPSDDLRRIERSADVEELVEQLADSAELLHPTLEQRAVVPAWPT